MTQPNTTLTTLLALGATALFISACGGDPNDFAAEEPVESDSAAIFGSDSCKDIDINITNAFEDNGQPVEIRVLKVEAWSDSEGRYLLEDLPNRELDPGEDDWWMNQDLAHAENDLITKFRIYFNFRETDGDWSDSTTRVFDIPNETCRADANFELIVNP